MPTHQLTSNMQESFRKLQSYDCFINKVYFRDKPSIQEYYPCKILQRVQRYLIILNDYCLHASHHNLMESALFYFQLQLSTMVQHSTRENTHFTFSSQHYFKVFVVNYQLNSHKCAMMRGHKQHYRNWVGTVVRIPLSTHVFQLYFHS